MPRAVHLFVTGISTPCRLAPALLAALLAASARLPSSHAAPSSQVRLLGLPVLGAHVAGELIVAPGVPELAAYALPLDAGERITLNLWFSIRPDETGDPEPVEMLRLRVVAPDGREATSPLCITRRLDERRYGIIKSCAPFRFVAGPAGRYALVVEDRTLVRHPVAWSLLSRRDFPRENEAME